MQMSAVTLVAGSVTQIVVGGLLVFGVGPLPELGIAGAAIAVVVGFGLAAVLQIIYLRTGRAGVTLRLTGIPVRLSAFAALLRVGLLAAVSPFSSVATVIVITGFVARFGDEALAGYGIGARLEFLMIPTIFGIGAATITMVQMLALAFLIVGDAGWSEIPVVEIGTWGLWIAALLTLYTGYDYLRAGLRHVTAESESELARRKQDSANRAAGAD